MNAKRRAQWRFGLLDSILDMLGDFMRHKARLPSAQLEPERHHGGGREKKAGKTSTTEPSSQKWRSGSSGRLQ